MRASHNRAASHRIASATPDDFESPAPKKTRKQSASLTADPDIVPIVAHETDGSPVKLKASGRRAATSPASPVAISPPVGWRETWEIIVELRKDRTAVVDFMGSESISGSASPEERAYHVLVSLMLSSQTKDTVNFATMIKLRAHGLTPANILATDDETLDGLIRAVGFHNNKVKFLKQTAAILISQHGGRVPDTMAQLLSLPGVGPKMSLILLSVVYNKVEGISVDTHVHRITNQLGWVGVAGPTKTPEHTRKAIEAWMPRDVWPEVNLLLVGLGQEVQTEKAKLLRKAVLCSRPVQAARLLVACGMDVAKVAKQNGIELPDGWLADAEE